MKKTISAVLALLCLLSAFACGGQAVTAQNTSTATEAPVAAEASLQTEAPAPTIGVVKVDVEAKPTVAPATPEPTPEPTEEPTPTPTPEPTEEPTPSPTPEPTRVPREGDIAVNFPDYDTGADADYSYQSDELRIAINVTVDKENKQTYYIADIWMRNIDCFRTGFGRGKFNTGTEDGDKLAKRENAIFAVNGSYNKGLTFHNGGPKTKGFQSTTANRWTTWAACFLFRDGTMKVYDRRYDKFNYSEIEKSGLWQAWQFGPALVQNGEISKNNTLKTRDPRNVLGYYEPGHYVVMTCDGGRNDATGMTGMELAEKMHELGVQEAINLDGGISAVMVFMGEIINRPEARWDEKKQAHVYGRPLVDMLLFAEYDAEGRAPDLATVTASRIKGKNVQ